MSSSSTAHSNNPWWREPWPWILMAGPFLTLIGCAITIVLAVQYFADEPIVTGVEKRGLVVSKTDSPAANVTAPVKPD